MANFPDLCPTKRTYTPPQYATKRYTSISGAGTTRLYGSKGFDAGLGLEFVVNGSQLTEVTECWNRSRGSYEAVSLPVGVIASSESLANELSPQHLEWHWADAPSVETLTPDLYRVKANFVAQLEVST